MALVERSALTEEQGFQSSDCQDRGEIREKITLSPFSTQHIGTADIIRPDQTLTAFQCSALWTVNLRLEF